MSKIDDHINNAKKKELADSEAYFQKLRRDIALAKSKLIMTETLLDNAKKALKETDLHTSTSNEIVNLEIELKNESEYLRRIEWGLMFYRRF